MLATEIQRGQMLLSSVEGKLPSCFQTVYIDNTSANPLKVFFSTQWSLFSGGWQLVENVLVCSQRSQKRNTQGEHKGEKTYLPVALHWDCRLNKNQASTVRSEGSLSSMKIILGKIKE